MEPLPAGRYGGNDMSQANAAVRRVEPDNDWQALLDVYDVRFIVLDVQRDAGWQQTMCRRPGWSVDAEDGETVLYARSGAAGGNHV